MNTMHSKQRELTLRPYHLLVTWGPLTSSHGLTVIYILPPGWWECSAHLFPAPLQGCHRGSLNLTVVASLTPQKSAGAANQGFPQSPPKLVVKHLPAHHSPDSSFLLPSDLLPQSPIDQTQPEPSWSGRQPPGAQCRTEKGEDGSGRSWWRRIDLPCLCFWGAQRHLITLVWEGRHLFCV